MQYGSFKKMEKKWEKKKQNMSNDNIVKKNHLSV